MNKELPMPFPELFDKREKNPAFSLFGKRLVKDQTIVEYVAEFLAVVASEKMLNNRTVVDPIPKPEELKEYLKSKSGIDYKVPIRLNLKLFAFLIKSKIGTRHKIHIQQYMKINREIQEKIGTNGIEKKDVVEKIEEFLGGLQGAGANRAWCAQCFYPLTGKLLLQETIWNESVAKREAQKLESWEMSIDDFRTYYSTTKYNFMAGGGEVLYLQICNAFATDKEKIRNFLESNNIDTVESPNELFEKLTVGLQFLMDRNFRALEQLVDFIEGIDPETAEKVNAKLTNRSTEWCPRESWQEGYLFALEMRRLLEAVLDPAERLELLMFGCALQVLRSLCAQSARYVEKERCQETALGYAWLFSFADSPLSQRKLSQMSLKAVQNLIYHALRHEALQEVAEKSGDKEKMYREVDEKYGHKLFLALGKKLGIIVPRTGTGARLVMTDSLIRYLVMVLIFPGERCTYDQFLQRMFRHFGIAIEGQQVEQAMAWMDQPVNKALANNRVSELTEMLRAGGFLIELSDGLSIVWNPFGKE